MAFVKWLAAVGASIAVLGVAHAHDLGPPVGAPVPAREAQDQTGAARTVASLGGRRGLVLLVTRAADWCPYCQQQMIELESVRAQIESRGWKLVSITTDTTAELARFQARSHIGYPMLSDEQATLVRALDLLDPTQPPGRRHNGLPVPTMLFVSPEGRVLARLGDADFRARPSTETVLATLDRLN